MRSPVRAPDGEAYDRSTLVDHLTEHGRLPNGQQIGGFAAWVRDQDLVTRSADPDGSDVPTDPITYERFRQPVVASDGRTYDRSTLVRLLRSGDGRSPFTRMPLATVAWRNRTLERQLGLPTDRPPVVQLLEAPRRRPTAELVAQTRVPRRTGVRRAAPRRIDPVSESGISRRQVGSVLGGLLGMAGGVVLGAAWGVLSAPAAFVDAGPTGILLNPIAQALAGGFEGMDVGADWGSQVADALCRSRQTRPARLRDLAHRTSSSLHEAT